MDRAAQETVAGFAGKHHVTTGRVDGPRSPAAAHAGIGLSGGGRLGTGRQYFPWIHREDIAAICQWLLDNPKARGAYNASAPAPVTNAEFTSALGRALARPTVVPVPAAALKLLFGEMSGLLLMSDRMLPTRLLEAGFKFRYPDLAPALAAIFARRA